VASKRKVSLTLDSDLIDELGDLPDTALSTQVNEAIRIEVSRRRRQRALRDLLEHLDAEDGPLTGEDLEGVAYFEQLLGGS
jgi:antitoxin CcdA